MIARRIAISLGLIVSLFVATASVVGAAGITVPPQNPRADVWAVPAYSFTPRNDHSYLVGGRLPACWSWGKRNAFVPNVTLPHCVPNELAAMNRARHAESIGGFALPRNFNKLTVPDQLLVLTDIERVSRGEEPIPGIMAQLNPDAQQGAAANADPLLSSATDIAGATGAYASNYAAAVNTLDANYEWMYTDGWDGKDTLNGVCTSASAAGCWGHRGNILLNTSRMPCETSSCTIVMGVGYVHDGTHDGYNSYTEIFVQLTGVTPVLSYTWQQALAEGAKA
jgi:hypothetical protein